MQTKIFTLTAPKGGLVQLKVFYTDHYREDGSKYSSIHRITNHKETVEISIIEFVDAMLDQNNVEKIQQKIQEKVA